MHYLKREAEGTQVQKFKFVFSKLTEDLSNEKTVTSLVPSLLRILFFPDCQFSFDLK